jgi:chorismate mutase-like protein
LVISKTGKFLHSLEAIIGLPLLDEIKDWRMKKIARLDLSKKLKKKRKEIDLIDRKLLTLLNQRLRTALEIGRVKKKMGRKIYDPKREHGILERIKLRNKGPLRDEKLEKIFQTIIKVSRQFQK